MTIREIIKRLESERDSLKKENDSLKKDLKKIISEKNSIEDELKSLKSLLFENEQKEKEIEIEEVEPQITSIVTNVDGKVNVSIVEGGAISIDDVVEEPKPKRSRRKKTEETPIFVEPVEETENA